MAMSPLSLLLAIFLNLHCWHDDVDAIDSLIGSRREETERTLPGIRANLHHGHALPNTTLKNLCYCKGESYDAFACEFEDTCIKHQDAACFHSVQQVYLSTKGRTRLRHTYGCAPLERGGGGSHLTCNSWRSTHSTPTSIACCYEGNYCNQRLEPPKFIGSEKTPVVVGNNVDNDVETEYNEEDAEYDAEMEKEGDGNNRPTIWAGPLNLLTSSRLFTALAFLLAGVMLGVGLFLFGFATTRQWRKKRGADNVPIWLKKLRGSEASGASVESGSLVATTKTTDLLYLATTIPDRGQIANNHMVAQLPSFNGIVAPAPEQTMSSGSDGAMALNQRTIAMDLTMLDTVARGRFGEVKKAIYRGSIVAVKSFYTTEEESWRNERDIYQTQMLNHENILQYVAADIASSMDSMTQMLLITDFHPLGSLYDYLQARREPLAMAEVLQIAMSIVAGLEHLHTAVRGTGGGRKPEIAHRDIKSKNVIVKRVGVCALADFGLALRSESDGSILPSKFNIMAGTKRYMSPEVLSRRLNPANFAEFKSADLYSYALVLWEVVNCLPDARTEAISPQQNAGAFLTGAGQQHHRVGPTTAPLQTIVDDGGGGFDVDEECEHHQPNSPSPLKNAPSQSSLSGLGTQQPPSSGGNRRHGRAFTSQSSSSGIATFGSSAATGTMTTTHTSGGSSSYSSSNGGGPLSAPKFALMRHHKSPYAGHGAFAAAVRRGGEKLAAAAKSPTYQQLDSTYSENNGVVAVTSRQHSFAPSLHQLPYNGMVDNDPSIEQMRRVVVDQRLRPLPLRREMTEANVVLQQLCELMRECWSENPRSRHTALKVKKELLALMTASPPTQYTTSFCSQ